MKVKLVKNQDFFQITTKSVNEIVENDKVVGVEIEGYASTKDKDRGKDIVEPTAFKNALDLYMTNPVVLLQHDADKPIGLVTQATIDSKGLYVKAKITEDTDGVFSKLKNKVLRAFSIGYRIKDYEINEVKDDQGDVTGWEQIIKDLELFEISVVSIPMNPYALTKSMANCFEKEAEAEETAEVDTSCIEDDTLQETNEIEQAENEENIEEKENEEHPTVVDLWAEEIEANNLVDNEETETVETEEIENEENVEEKTLTSADFERVAKALEESVENAEPEIAEDPAQSEPVENTEIIEETTDSSENGGETTPNEDEISQVEKAVNVDLKKAQVFIDMEAKMVAQENKIAELSKKLENTAEVIKECVDVITKLNAMVENTVVKTGFSFEKPMAKKSGYGQIAQLAKSI